VKPKKDIPEMIGEFLREAAVLTLVFYPLEQSRSSEGLGLGFFGLTFIASSLLLMTGMLIEKFR
jgi:hypothetical protein